MAFFFGWCRRKFLALIFLAHYLVGEKLLGELLKARGNWKKRIFSPSTLNTRLNFPPLGPFNPCGWDREFLLSTPSPSPKKNNQYRWHEHRGEVRWSQSSRYSEPPSSLGSRWGPAPQGPWTRLPTGRQSSPAKPPWTQVWSFPPLQKVNSEVYDTKQVSKEVEYDSQYNTGMSLTKAFFVLCVLYSIDGM